VISNNGNLNNATTDFAICCNDSSLTISNNLILDNLEVAIYTCWSRSDSALILNNTIANNIYDHGVWCYGSSPTIKNNIIVGNYGGIVAIYSSFPKISYNDVWNNTWVDYNAQTGSICEPGIGDISADPMFVDAANGDYHLQYNSPCIDAGINAPELPDYDFDGDLRILDGNNDGTAVVDMGADEYYIGIVEVSIDIKPGSYPNTINLGSQGNIPVAIFSTSDFDTTTIDPTTVTLAGASVKLKCKGTQMSSFEDVNGDGLKDIVAQVDVTALELTVGDMEAVLEGKTFDGIFIRGTDTVRIIE
jgi:parallel beta-helix repeat protein